MFSFQTLKQRLLASAIVAIGFSLSSAVLAEGFKEGDRALQVAAGFVHAQGSVSAR